MNTAPTRSNAPYGWTLLIMTVLLWFLPLIMPFPNSGWEWKILLIGLVLSGFFLGICLVLSPETLALSGYKYLKYLGLACAAVSLLTLAAIPVLQVLRTLRFIDVP